MMMEHEHTWMVPEMAFFKSMAEREFRAYCVVCGQEIERTGAEWMRIGEFFRWAS